MNFIVPHRIGLTGGIATGKSTVSHYLQQKYLLPILDADIYAREAVQNDSPILQAIFKRYGSRVQSNNSQLNRQLLGEIIFNDAREKAWLESQIHPLVYRRLSEELKTINRPILVLAIPLLFEANFTDLVTDIWVVSCTFEQQIARLEQRNKLTRKQAIARINSQLPLEEKIANADIVLDNSKDIEYLYKQVDRAIQQL